MPQIAAFHPLQSVRENLVWRERVDCGPDVQPAKRAEFVSPPRKRWVEWNKTSSPGGAARVLTRTLSRLRKSSAIIAGFKAPVVVVPLQVSSDAESRLPSSLITLVTFRPLAYQARLPSGVGSSLVQLGHE